MTNIATALRIMIVVVLGAWWALGALLSTLLVWAFGLVFVHGKPVEYIDHLTGATRTISSGYYLIGSLLLFYFFVIRAIQFVFERPQPGPIEDTDLAATRATRSQLRKAGLLRRQVP